MSGKTGICSMNRQQTTQTFILGAVSGGEGKSKSGRNSRYTLSVGDSQPYSALLVVETGHPDLDGQCAEAGLTVSHEYERE